MPVEGRDVFGRGREEVERVLLGVRRSQLLGWGLSRGEEETGAVRRDGSGGTGGAGSCAPVERE